MYKFKIDSMNCSSCLHNIDDALKEVDKSVTLEADFKNKILSVNSSLPKEKVADLIEETGYPVKEINS